MCDFECPMCGKPYEQCKCPECPVCGRIGDPTCIRDGHYRTFAEARELKAKRLEAVKRSRFARSTRRR